MTAAATAAVFVTLVAVGVGYVVNADDPAARITSASPTERSAAAAKRAPADTAPTTGAPTTAAPGPDVPGFPVTISASPTPRASPTKVTRTPKPKPTVAPEPPPVLDFTISSFNVLGSSHTSGSGKRPGMASGRTRAARAANLIRRHGSDVVGFQELQRDQLATLARQTNLDFWPGFAGSARDSENSVGWRSDLWIPVERNTIAIPYFNGHTRAMPYVRLKSRTTGLEAWFANFHNPADTSRYRGQQRFRNRATQLEVNLANRLIRETGLPVFITGDMNEREEYLCAMTRGAPMLPARGGGADGCRGANPRAVDWIFGSQDVDFLGYYEDRSRLVDMTTDHPVVVARARITGSADDAPADADN